MMAAKWHYPEAQLHPIVAERQETRTRGARIADAVVGLMGSWRFIIIQSAVVACWIVLNAAAIAFRWDPYPFILLNLLFSTQAAYASPLILMAANRSSDRDRAFASHQFDEIELIRELLERNTQLTAEVHDLTVAAREGGRS